MQFCLKVDVTFNAADLMNVCEPQIIIVACLQRPYDASLVKACHIIAVHLRKETCS